MTAITKEDKMAPILSRGFRGRRAADVDPARIPPGQYVTADLPVISAGPAPRTAPESRDLPIAGEPAGPRGWTREEFRALPGEEITRDIHRVAKSTKPGTVWRGASADTLPEGTQTAAGFVTQYPDGGYTANLPLEDVTGGKARVVLAYDGQPLEPELPAVSTPTCSPRLRLRRPGGRVPARAGRRRSPRRWPDRSSGSDTTRVRSRPNASDPPDGDRAS